MGIKRTYMHSDYPRMTKAHSASCLACAYEDGFKTGRASREGLREGLELVLRYMEKRGGCSCIDGYCPVCFAQKALEADGEGR